MVLFRDLQLHMDQSDPMLVRRIKDILRIAKSNGHSIILLGCQLKLPAELEHEITHVDFSVPDNSQLGVVLDGILKSAKLKAPHDVVRESCRSNPPHPFPPQPAPVSESGPAARHAQAQAPPTTRQS